MRDALAVFVFIAAAVPDWFDGYLARALGAEDQTCTMLDRLRQSDVGDDALMVIVAFSRLVAVVGFARHRDACSAKCSFPGLRESFLGDVSAH